MPNTSRREELLNEIETLNPERGQTVRNIVSSVPVNAIENPRPELDIPQIDPQEVEAPVRSATQAARSFLTSQQQQTENAQERFGQSETELRRLMGLEAQAPEVQATLEDRFDLEERQSQVNELNTRIEQQIADLESFDDQTFLGEEQLRQEGAARDITKNVFGAQANQRRLQRAIERTGMAAELRGVQAAAAAAQGNLRLAQDSIDRAMAAQFDPIRRQIENEQFFITQRYDQLTNAQQRQADARLQLLSAQMNEIGEARALVNQAVASGYATPSEIEQLSTLPPQEARVAAQQIIGRATGQERRISQANANLARRANLLELAAAGDPQAIAELGYDPNNLDGGMQAALELERQEAELQTDIDVMSSLLGNDRGLQASTGAVRNATLQGLVRGGDTEGVTLTRFTPVVGNIQGAADSINAKRDFLSGLSYLVNSTTFKEIMDMRASGVTFGNMTEGERIAAGRAANELNAAMEVSPEGQVEAVNASEEKTRQMIADIMNAYNAKQEELRADAVMTAEDDQELNALLSE